ncbi:MAG: hypothetical protein M3Y80_01480 [Verrucomicrobiota bacterium]|nr:hypothetical protein [Verrucomicrobiota bacterium]
MKLCSLQAGAVTALALVLAAAPAEARTRRHRRPNPLRIALEPLLAARSVVHAIADPIVEPIISTAPRALFAAAAAPIHAVRGEPMDEEAEDTAVAEPSRIRIAEPVAGKSFRIAYMVPQRAVNFPPRDAEQEKESHERDPNNDSAIQTAPARLSSGNRPMVSGSRALLRNGVAYAPSQAPQSVKNAIWAANGLRRKPYVWGGGHSSFHDGGYDCSGTVSFALHNAGALGSPLPSSDLARFGQRGRGRWFTIYARNGHTFAVIAGLRLDTTDFQNGGNTGPRWHADMRDTGGYAARHPAGL